MDPMEEGKLLLKIAEDVGAMKQKIDKIEREVEELAEDLHEVRPEYLEKLKRIDSGKFLSREEFNRRLEE